VNPLQLELPSGVRAVVTQSDGERAVVVCAKAFPPGSTIDGTAVDGSGAYRIKVRLCRRRSDAEATYEIEGRFVSLTRAQRARVVE
jgi:hypothetical protein